MTTFKFSKQLGQYYQIDYVSGLGEYSLISGYSNLPAIAPPMRGYVWVLSIKAAADFIAHVRKFEREIRRELQEKSLNIDYRLIILSYLEAIESISSGFDARSKISINELAGIFVSSYVSKRDEAIKFCEDTLKAVEENKYQSYTSGWKRFDKHNENIQRFMLDIKPIKEADFELNLESLCKSTTELLEKLKKINNSK